MMATRKQIEKKKKSREERSKARVAARRHKLDQLKKQDRQSARLNRKFRERAQPIIKDPEVKKKLEEVEAKKAKDKLEKNLQILQALEDEYLKEKEIKKQLNDDLEAEGHKTFQDKMKALEEKAKAEMTPEQAKTGMMDKSEKI